MTKPNRKKAIKEGQRLLLEKYGGYSIPTRYFYEMVQEGKELYSLLFECFYIGFYQGLKAGKSERIRTREKRK